MLCVRKELRAVGPANGRCFFRILSCEKKNPNTLRCSDNPDLAEKVGFEPTRRFHVLRDFEKSPPCHSSSLLVTVFCIKELDLRIKCGILRKSFGKVIEN